MIEETKKILEELIAPPDLIQQFVALLKEKKIGVEQRDDRRAKYFLATNTDKKILVLAHESSKDGWWGIGGDLIGRVRKLEEERKFDLTGWGAALIDEKPDRGYWLTGDAILELNEIGLVRLDSQGKYHFNRNVLQAQTELVNAFSSIERFLLLTGLKA